MESTAQSVLDRWGLFSLADSDLLGRVTVAFVFGPSGNEALLVTSDDCVYCLGGSNAGCLPAEAQHGGASGPLVKLDALCGRQVIDVACGSGPHILALTSSGDLYTWGNNTHCQLGNGNTNQLLLPALCSLLKVRSIACGGNHSLALTQDGEAYAWGHNNCGQVGSGTTVNQPTPRRLAGPLTNRPIVRVSCCQSSSFAVSASGEAFAWGCNKHGQLGVGGGANQSVPVKVEALAGQFVAQLACGQSHALALTDEGELYTWGSNGFGQLACPDCKLSGGAFAPTRVLEQRGRFIDVGAVHYSNTSAGMTETGLVLAWGQCRGQTVAVPLETRFLSVNDVFACLSCPAVTCKRLEFRASSTICVSQSIHAAFNDPATSDVTFLVEGKPLHAHKSLLRIRCEHFRTMFNENCWSESQLNRVVIQEFSYSVYRAFLEFLYTDNISLSPEEAIGLLDLANCYCEAPLKAQCERLIRNSITVENALLLYSAAVKYSATELQKFCFEFTIHHLTRIVTTESFDELDQGTLRSFMRQAASAGAFKY